MSTGESDDDKHIKPATECEQERKCTHACKHERACKEARETKKPGTNPRKRRPPRRIKRVLAKLRSEIDAMLKDLDRKASAHIATAKPKA